MTLPSSRYKALRLALISYLSSETIALDSTASTWNHYSETFSPSDPPKGSVFLGSTNVGTQTNLEVLEKLHRVTLRWKVGASTTENAIALAEDWSEAIFLGNTSIMRELYIKGVSGTYGGIALQNAFKGIELVSGVTLSVVGNEDGGAIVSVTAQYEFRDWGAKNQVWFMP